MHHLPSIHGHVIWYITYHQYLAMSYDTLTNCPWKNDNMMWFITYHRYNVISYDTSPTVMPWDTSHRNNAWSCYVIHHLPSMHGYHLPLLVGHVMWNIIYHRWWSYHMIHHLPSMHGYVIWYITYHRYMIMSCDTSPTTDAWLCHMIHHLPSILGHFIWYIN